MLIEYTQYCCIYESTTIYLFDIHERDREREREKDGTGLLLVVLDIFPKYIENILELLGIMESLEIHMLNKRTLKKPSILKQLHLTSPFRHVRPLG